MADGVPEVADEELVSIELAFQRALKDRSLKGLNVLGYGEIGLAIGWPFNRPAAVVKRLPSAPDPAEATILFDMIRRYELAVGSFVTVTPTDQRSIVSENGWTVPFLVQPLLPRETLAEVILANTEPDPEHPLILAVRDAVVSANTDGRQAIDCQFSNFAWADDQLAYFDIGSPLLYDESRRPEIEIGSYSRVLPSALMPVLRKLITKISLEMATVEGGLAHAAMSILRIEQDRWLRPVLSTFNQSLDKPILVAEVEAKMAGVHKDMKAIKRLARLERSWSARVRRRPYDSFITDSFTHEIL